jgi:regulator of replication initiation timing
MLEMNAKQFFSILLTVLLIRPSPIVAASAATAPPATVLGSITSRGVVHVGAVRVPDTSTLFSGDQVQTAAGSALIQYQQGVRVILGTGSLASFSSSRVELQKGQMSFNASAGGPLFAASTLRIEPTSSKSSANVTLQDKKATVAVTEGSLRVVDPSGVQLASLRTGEARLFEEASAASPSPASPAPAAAAAAPQGGGGGSRAWLLALGVGIVGTSLGIAGIVRANNADDRAEEAQTLATQSQAQSDQLRATITQLQAQNTALTTQVNTLRTQLSALSSAAAAQNVVLQNLAAAIAEVDRLENQLNSTQNQLTQLLADIARQGGTASAAQLSQLQSLGSALSTLFQGVQNATNRVSQLVEDLRRIIISGTRLP